MDASRRKAIETLLQSLGITFIPGTAVLSVPILIVSEEFLGQCNASIKACWQLLQHKGFDRVEEILSKNMPRLTELATSGSEHQDMAAGLAMQAKILEGKLAWHRADLRSHEIACREAVRFGKLTNDPYMHATALLYLAYAYIVCPPLRPEKAVSLFLKALKLIDSEASLLHVDIYVSLANAYAQRLNSIDALFTLNQAESILSANPQRTPDFLYREHGLSAFYREKGKAYLYLAPHFSDNNYFQWAYDAFSSENPVTTRGASEIAILQADAARGLGQMDHFIELLQRGVHLALEITSQKRLNEANEVMGRIPSEWRRETAVQQLQRDISHAIVVARR